MTSFDWFILVAYMTGVLAMGVYFSRRQSRADEFFLAGRAMHWFPIGLSIMATAFSAINYTAFSGEVFQHGLYVALSLPVFVLVAWPVTRVFMPFYYGLQVASIYEYLERRFDVRVRCLAAGLFLLWRVAWMAVVLFVPCRVLHALTDVPLTHLILVAGGIATLYTMAGGIRAVMWTDVVQFFVLLAGLVAGLCSGARQSGGFLDMLRLGIDDGLARPFYPFDPDMFSFDPTVRITLWSALFGTFIAFMARYGADQVVVQRYLSARNLRNARLGFHLNYATAVIALVVLGLMGFAIHAHAVTAHTLGEAGLKPVDYFAAFVLALPDGVSGLIVAGLFAATMSSIDSGVNSCATVYMTDFQERLFGSRDEERSVRQARVLTFVFGAAATLAACYVDRLGTLFDIANKIVNGLGSPLLALLFLGMFSRRVNALGMLWGGLLGALWCVRVSLTMDGIALHYYAVVNLAGAMIACYACSATATRFGHTDTDDQLAWTWWEQRKRERG